jgi:hypothetical protein
MNTDARMSYFQILYRNASGKTALTHTYICNSVDEAVQHTTDFVRKNLISVWEVDGETPNQKFRSTYW